MNIHSVFTGRRGFLALLVTSSHVRMTYNIKEPTGSSRVVHLYLFGLESRGMRARIKRLNREIGIGYVKCSLVMSDISHLPKCMSEAL